MLPTEGHGKRDAFRIERHFCYRLLTMAESYRVYVFRVASVEQATRRLELFEGSAESKSAGADARGRHAQQLRRRPGAAVKTGGRIAHLAIGGHGDPTSLVFRSHGMSQQGTRPRALPYTSTPHCHRVNACFERPKPPSPTTCDLLGTRELKVISGTAPANNSTSTRVVFQNAAIRAFVATVARCTATNEPLMRHS